MAAVAQCVDAHSLHECRILRHEAPERTHQPGIHCVLAPYLEFQIRTRALEVQRFETLCLPRSKLGRLAWCLGLW